MAASPTDNHLSPINWFKDLNDFRKTLDDVNTFLNENSVELTCLKQQFKEQKKALTDLQLINNNNTIIISEQQVQIQKLKEILNKRTIEEPTVYNLRKRPRS